MLFMRFCFVFSVQKDISSTDMVMTLALADIILTLCHSLLSSDWSFAAANRKAPLCVGHCSVKPGSGSFLELVVDVWYMGSLLDFFCSYLKHENYSLTLLEVM